MNNFKRLIREFVAPYWKKILQASLLTGLEMALLLPTPYITKWVLDVIIPNKDTRLLAIAFAAYISLHFLREGTSFAVAYTLQFIGQRMMFRMRTALHRKLQQLQLAFYDAQLPGKIMARIVNDVAAIQNLVSHRMVAILTDFILMVAISIILFTMSPRLFLIVWITLPAYGLTFKFFVKRIREVNRKIREKVAQIYGIIGERVSAVRVVKSFAKEDHEMRRFTKEVDEHFGLNMENARLHTYLGTLAGLTSGIGTTLLLWYGGHLVKSGALTLGSLIAFYSYTGYLFGPMVRLTNVNISIQRAMVAVNRVFAVLDEPVVIKDAPDAIILKDPKGEIEFKDVFFKYDTSEDWVLSDINLKIPAGAVVGVVGPSGCGKTTLLNLIMRFYDVTKGSLLIDGVDVRKIKLTSLRKIVGYVAQETVLFSGTIKENIAYGRKDVTDEEIVEAAKAAEIHDYIASLPEGYNTMIGEKGVTLSGGQKQRLAIARALLTNPRILLLDDCSSALDAETEYKIRKTLEHILGGRTCIIVSHRLASVAKADFIVVLENGRIAQIGKHEDLIKEDGIYRRMYVEQFQGVVLV